MRRHLWGAMRALAMILKFFLAAAVLTLPQIQSLAAEGTVVIMPKQPSKDGPAAFRALGPVFRDKVVVQLGESIHMTNELATARLPLVKYLHERQGFNVMLLEGQH